MNNLIPALGVASASLALTGLINVAMNRHQKHHDAAFKQVMWEIWENPKRDPARIEMMNKYLANGFFHIVINEPPLGAVDHLKEFSYEEYNEHCLSVAKERFAKLKQ